MAQPPIDPALLDPEHSTSQVAPSSSPSTSRRFSRRVQPRNFPGDEEEDEEDEQAFDFEGRYDPGLSSEGSEYEDDEEELDDEDRGHGEAQLDEEEEGELMIEEGDFGRLVHAMKDGGGGEGLSLGDEWDRSIEDELSEFRNELRGASGVGKSRVRRPRSEPALTPELKTLLGQANMHYVLRSYDQAISSLEEVIRLEPTVRNAWYLLGTIYSEMGDTKRALQVRVMAAHLTPGASDIWKDLGRQSREAGSMQQAVYCYQQAIKADKNDVDAIWDRAFLLKEIGRTRQAADGFSSLLKHHPHDPNILRELCPLLIALHQPEAARDHLSAALLYFRTTYPVPTPAELDHLIGLTEIRMLVDLLLVERRWADVIRVVNEGVRWLQGRAGEEFWDLVGDDREWDRERGERGDNQRVEQGLGVNELDYELRTALGRARLAKGEVEEAKRHFEIVLEQDLIDYVSLYGDIADAYVAANMHDEALDILQEMAENDLTSSAIVFQNMGDCFKALGELQNAETCYNNVVQMQPDNLDVKMKLAEVYEETGDKVKALSLVNQVIAGRRKLRGGAADSASTTGPSSAPAPEDSFSFFDENQPSSSARESKRAERSAARQRAVQLEKKREEEMVEGFRKLQALQEDVDRGDWEKEAEWIDVAGTLVEWFRETPALFPRDRTQRFKGVIRMSKKKRGPVDLDSRAEDMATRIQRAIVDDSSSAEPINDDGEVDSFRGIAFDDWVTIFMQYALLLTKHHDVELAEEVLRHITYSNVMRRAERLHPLRLTLLACAMKAGHPTTVIEAVRAFMYSEQFSCDAARMLSAFLGGGIHALTGFTDLNLQKFILRELKVLDNAGLGKEIVFAKRTGRWTVSGIGAADNEGEDEPAAGSGTRSASPEAERAAGKPRWKPTNANPIWLTLYGQIMLAARSAQGAIFYLLRAYDLEPNDSLLCMTLGVAYLYRAFQRQADNRHHQVAQAMAFFTRYRKLRGPGQEVEYNFGRAFHQTGLLHFAVKHYQRVLTLAEQSRATDMDVEATTPATGDFSKEAAYNLSLIYMATGAQRLARDLAKKWLSV